MRAVLLLLVLGACAAPTPMKTCIDPPPAMRSTEPAAMAGGSRLARSAFQADEHDPQIASPTPPLRPFATTILRDPDADRRRWIGKPIDLDVRLAPLHDVIRLLADVGHANVVVGDGVEGQVTMRLVNVPWDQALDVVVRAKGFVATKEGDVIFVTRPGS